MESEHYLSLQIDVVEAEVVLEAAVDISQKHTPSVP